MIAIGLKAVRFIKFLDSDFVGFVQITNQWALKAPNNMKLTIKNYFKQNISEI